MSDKLVFDLAQEVEGTPNVFVRKDWINILDNQNQNYSNNQSVIDTSQLSNSNKYMSYREAYFSMPLTITIGQTAQASTLATGVLGFAAQPLITPATPATSWDYACGLKSWFGQIIHSFTLDYNGTTIIQQTPYTNMWNSFKLITSLSLGDIRSQGPTLGFYPDDPLSWNFIPAGTSVLDGQGMCNNRDVFNEASVVSGAFNSFRSGQGNQGFLQRQQCINFDVDGITTGGSTYGALISGGASSAQQVWKSYISQKRSQTAAIGSSSGAGAMVQFSCVCAVYLKHVHSFFNMCPLLKGVFMKMTMNLNNCSSTVLARSTYTGNTSPGVPASFACTAVQNSVGGVNPLMIASAVGANGCSSGFFTTTTSNGTSGAGAVTNSYIFNVSVGAICLDSTLSGLSPANSSTSKSVYLYIPAYTFNPVFEQAYLSSPVKQIKYTDIYQYQVVNVQTGQNFNNLLTNGIANIKSVLIHPFYSPVPSGVATLVTSGTATTTNYSTNTGFLSGSPVWQSPFDSAGCGTVSPLCWITNFNVQVSGQNAIYNIQRYNFEEWNNQLYGQNAVNGGLTDGLTSGLIDRQSFDMNYTFYYVNVERMLPVEQSVPKSIQILGQNLSASNVDLYCFIEYGVDISIDALTGARV